jgi:hypothetical protein
MRRGMAPHCCDATLELRADSRIPQRGNDFQNDLRVVPANYPGIGKVRVSVASACTGTSCGAAGTRSTNCIS